MNDSIFQRKGLDLYYSKKLSLKDALCGFSFDIEHIIQKNVNDGLLWASSLNYTDMWTRDTFFAFISNKKSLGIFADELVNFQRDDGLIPLYIGRGNACLKCCCSFKATGPIKATYSDVKTGDEPTDSCFQFIIIYF